MMKPLAPFAVRGLIWYQGERNARYMSGVPEVTEANWFHKVSGMKEYGDILSAWVKRYRKEWHKEGMHFMDARITTQSVETSAYKCYQYHRFRRFKEYSSKG